MSNKQQTIVFNLQANIDQIKQSANEIDKMFSKLNLPQNLRTSFSKTFNKLTEDIRTFEVSASKGFNSLSDAKKAEKNIENIVTGFERLRVQIKDIKGLPAEKLLPKESLDRLKKYKELLDKASKLSLKDNSASIRKATAAVSQAEKKFSDSEKSAKRNKAAIEENQKDYDELTGKINSTKEALDRYFTRKNELKNIKNKTPEQAAEFSDLNARIKAAERSLTNYYKAQTQAKDEGEKLQAENSRLTTETEDFKNALDTARQALDDIKRSSGVTQEEIDKIRQSLANISNIDPNALPQTLQELIVKIQQLSGKEADLSSLKSALEQLGSAAKDAGTNAGDMGQSFHKTNTQVQEDLAKTNSEIAQLKSRLTYFFSAMNGIQLFKNAIRSAYESVKELDAAITEMAVVTDYSINDIWGNIPQYTQTAKELGATTKDVINSMVLYTQQGLDVAHATELSTQTMKMARIAGLEGAEATDLKVHWVFI